MTLEQFLDELEKLNDREWVITPEGWLRTFIDDTPTEGGPTPWDWMVSSVAHTAGREFSLMEWRTYLKKQEYSQRVIKLNGFR